ncbi:MAG: hypothetical protein RDU41_09185 [Clostridia bacterium]|nr:hypothetical protein [Clostridia bacterium]
MSKEINKAVLRIQKPQELVEAEARKLKLEAVANKAKETNLTDKEKLNLIIEQNQIILEMLKPPK